MKNQLLKKLSALIVTTVFFFSAAHAQIVYTDVNPDVKLTATGAYSLDLNNDGMIDYTINLTKTVNCGGGTNFTASIAIAGGDPRNSVDLGVGGFQLNDIIDTSLSWSTVSGSYTLYSQFCVPQYPLNHCRCFSSGSWNGITAFAALRLTMNGHYYYGWVHLKVINPSSITIFDYAYNSIPDHSILAGDTGGIAMNVHNIKGFSSIIVSPNVFQHSTLISFSLPQSEQVSVQIYDVQGRLIRTLADQIFSQGENQLQWNATDENGRAVSAGIYLLRMQTANESETIRLSVLK